jgi:hypothetical protein
LDTLAILINIPVYITFGAFVVLAGETLLDGALFTDVFRGKLPTIVTACAFFQGVTARACIWTSITGLGIRVSKLPIRTNFCTLR